MNSIFTNKGFAEHATLSDQQKESFIRELFILFYLLFLGSVFLLRFTHMGIFAKIVTVAEYTYIPGMFFAAGYELGFFHKKYQDKENYQKAALHRAFLWLMLYYGLSLIKECFLENRALFSTVKDLLAFLRLPRYTSIFASLFFLYVIGAFWGQRIMESRHGKWLFPLLSICGFLFAFLPKDLIGYSQIGIFTGADQYGACPILPYLFFILLGMSLGQMESFNIYSKFYLLMTILLLILGCGFILFSYRNPALIMIGVFLAFIGVTLCFTCHPLYEKIENKLTGLGSGLILGCRSFYDKKQGNAFFRFLFYLAGYTLIFVIMCYFVFYPYIHDHRSFIWSVDGLGQYVPKIYRFMEYIPSILKDLLHGNLNFKQYDFSSGLGATVAISYDPIYWLYLLFNPSQVEKAYTLMGILRFFLAGLSFSALVLYFKGSHFAAMLSSMVYIFSGYAIYAGTKHWQFLTPLILLPILVIAMEQIIKERKWYLMTVFVALSLLCSYYFLWMNTIAIGIYFVTRILCDKNYRKFSTFFTRGLIITGSYILGTSIGIISLFTSFASYMGSSRSEGGSMDKILTMTSFFYRPEWISDSFISFISDSFTPGLWLKLGFAPIALLALVLLFTRKNRKELKPLFYIGTLFCILPVFGYMFSGFSTVNNRWCFIYACLVAFILAEVSDRLLALNPKELKIMTGLVLLYGGIVFFSTKYRLTTILMPFGLLTATLIILYLINLKNPNAGKLQPKILLFGMVMLTIIFNANMYMTQEGHMETFVPNGTAKKSVSNTALRYLGDAVPEDQEFYRVANLKTSGNTRSSSLLLGYNDVSTFTSTLNSGIVDYHTAMGNCNWNIVSIYDYNARTIMHELAGVKYIGGNKKTQACVPYGYHSIFQKGSAVIYENEYALPLGYTYDSILSSTEASNYSAAEKQELTMMTAIVDAGSYDSNPNLDQTKTYPLSAHRLAITGIDLNGATMDEEKGLLTVEEGSTMTLHFAGEANAETYLNFHGDLYHAKDAKEHFLKTVISAKGTNYLYKFRIDPYTTGQEEFLFNLGYHEEAIDSCTLTFNAAGTLRFDEIAVCSQTMENYPQRVAALKEDVLEHVKVDTNMVSGDISLAKDKMLCISLPYQAGWTAYVDGEKTKIQRVNYQYMGLNLTPGEHHIELRYKLPGLKLALEISAGGLILFLLIIFFNFMRKKRKNISK